MDLQVWYRIRLDVWIWMWLHLTFCTTSFSPSPQRSCARIRICVQVHAFSCQICFCRSQPFRPWLCINNIYKWGPRPLKLVHRAVPLLTIWGQHITRKFMWKPQWRAPLVEQSGFTRPVLLLSLHRVVLKALASIFWYTDSNVKEINSVEHFGIIQYLQNLVKYHLCEALFQPWVSVACCVGVLCTDPMIQSLLHNYEAAAVVHYSHDGASRMQMWNEGCHFRDPLST